MSDTADASAYEQTSGPPGRGGESLGIYCDCIAAWIAATVSFNASAGLICRNSLPFVAVASCARAGTATRTLEPRSLSRGLAVSAALVCVVVGATLVR